MPWGFIIGAGASLLGGMMGADATENAAAQQADASRAATEEQKRQYDLTREDYAPYRAAGVQALGQLQSAIGKQPSAAEVMSDPGYQFGQDQGQQALDRKYAAAGGRMSGAAMKAASQFNTNYATTKYNDAYQRSQDRLNRLASLAGLGQTATSGSAAAGTSSANAISGILQNQGETSAAATMAGGNIWGNTANSIGALASRYSRSTYTPNSTGYAPIDNVYFSGASGMGD